MRFAVGSRRCGQRWSPMRLCLRLKLSRNLELRRKLIASVERPIVEDCSSRGRRVNNLFWGAVRVPDSDLPMVYAWEGQHWLGRLWIELRQELCWQS